MGVDIRSTLRLLQEMPAGKVAAGHQLVVVAMAAALVVVMNLAVFVDFNFSFLLVVLEQAS